VANFLCAVYAFPSIGKLMRCDSFCLINKKNIQCHQLLPTKDSLQKHILRANFQAAVWKRACQSIFGLPSAEKYGWVIEKNMLSVSWMDQQPASEALMLLISCGCNTNCTTKRCPCMSQGLCTYDCRCSDLCKKHESTRVSIRKR